MNIEYEATFINIDKNEILEKLKKAGAALVKPEFLQTRAVFDFPLGHEIPYGWLRVRNEGNQITMSIKVVKEGKIDDQKEICLKVDNFENAILFLKTSGCCQKSFQESKRAIWQLDSAEITIDEWPFLEPLVEIEGESEKKVKMVSEKIEFDWTQAKFCAVDAVYAKKYNLPEDVINNQMPKIVFDMENPFLHRK